VSAPGPMTSAITRCSRGGADAAPARLPAFAIAAPRAPVHAQRMKRSLAIASILVAASLAGPAAADAPQPERPRILVLPLPPTHAVDPSIARAFDARLLVALDDTRRVVTVTPSDEPECTSTGCLAALGTAADAAFVLSMTVVRETDGLTLFGTLVESKTATAARRIELARIEPASLARTAPAEIVPQIVAAGVVAPPAARPAAVLGISQPATAEARTAALALHDRLSAYRTFKVLPLDGPDRSTLTHRAELAISELSVVDRRRGLCTWRDGTLVGTFSIIDLANGRAVFTKTVRLSDSQRALLVKREQVVDALLDAAVADWMAAFHASGVEARLRRSPK
jgi:hypothetical protein